VVDVDTGDVQAGKGHVILRSNAIGSCIVVAAIHPGSHLGGLAHIMLPGKAPANCSDCHCRYAYNAILALLIRINKLAAGKQDLLTFMIGGANVLQRSKDTICEANIESVGDVLAAFGVYPEKKVVGGMERRSAILNLIKELVK
jgi:chemotaxis protein CheD